MPSQSWGPSVSTSSGSQLTLAYDSIVVEGATARITNPRISFYSKSGWSDSNNSITARGSLVVDAQVHSGTLNGGTRTWNCTAESVALQYGSTTTATFAAEVYGVSFFNGDQATNTYTMNVTLPARGYAAPAAPTGVAVVRGSDTSHTVSWSNTNPTSVSAPYQELYVDRTDNGGATWSTVSPKLTGNPTSYADKTTVANRRYRYRVRAVNTGGTGTSAPSASFSTTPAAPTNLSAVKDGTAIDVTWTNPAVGEAGVQVLDSLSGATATEVARLAADSTSWTHLNPATDKTHTYTARAWSIDPAGNLLYSATSTASNVVQLLAAPGQPTNLSAKVSGTTVSVVDGNDPVTLAWTHVAVDTTPQSAYELEYSTNGGTSWTGTGKVTSTTSSRTFAAGTFPNGLGSVLWRVRTWGQHVDASPWSSTASFSTSAKPTVNINYPANGSTIPGSMLTLAWTYFDPEGQPQSGFRAVLKSSTGVVLETIERTGTDSTVTFAANLADAATYSATVEVRQGAQWSTAAVLTSVTMDYLDPVVPLVDAVWDPQIGAVALRITNPAGTGGEPAADHNDVRRQIADGSWVTIADNVGPGAVVVDWTASVGQVNRYVVDAVSTLPSTASSSPVEVTAPRASGQRFWFNGGPNFSLVASFIGNPAVSRDLDVEHVVNHYANRPLGVPTDGEAIDRSFSVSGVLDGEWTLGEVDAFEAVMLAGKVSLYRDAIGQRYFCKLTKLAFDLSNPRAITIGASFVQVDWTEESYRPNPWLYEVEPGVWRTSLPTLDGVGTLDLIP